MINFNQITIVSFLSCAIVPLLITGPFLPDLLLSLLSLWFLYYCFINKLYYLFKNKYFYLFLAFCLFCIFSSILSENPLLSFESSLFYFRIGIFCVLISYLVNRDNKILDYFFYSLLISFSVLIIYAFIEYFFQLNKHPVRISSFFGDELILGSYLSRLLPLLIALFVIRKNKSLLEKQFFIIFLVCTYITVILSGERSAFFYINLSFLLILFFIRPNLKLSSTPIIICSSLILVFYLSISKIETGNNLLNRYTKSVISSMNLKVFFEKKEILEKDKNTLDNESKKSSKTEGNKGIVFFTEGHETLFRTAFNMFLDRPIIGHGPKMFRVKCGDPKYAEIVGSSDRGISSCMTHPHNFYIQLLAETGLIGFSFLFFLFVYLVFIFTKYIYYDFIKKKKIYSNYQICVLTCLLITVWPLIPNGNFFNNYLMIMYSLPVGFLKNKF